ncbi:hypothetical protein DBB42_11900 [Pseudomonas plecoglossicida]|uniref:Uncharacterized protein n=1 Tax=Pseudomonas plecoglossicida TaxID=70775 RepID=A0A2R7UKP5_PSEDL|nr:hypothetical protein DBB42_11900 [Pseudomonas plecoglossicida]
MDGLRAVFERATLSQRLLLFRRLARSKKSNDMTGGLGWNLGPLCGPSRARPLPQVQRSPCGRGRAREEGDADVRSGSGNR